MALLDTIKGIKTQYQTALENELKKRGLPAAVSSPAGGKTAFQQALAQPNLREMIRGGATEAELQERNDTGVVPQSYLDRQGRQNYTFWNAGRSTIGDYGIDDSNADTWRRAKSLYDAGDVNGAMDLVNGLSAQGKFGGWYDDAGNYYGLAQGYKGGANSSYLPVFGGNLIAQDVDTTGTNIWLTPDGKALHLGAGGALTDSGDTWSRQSKPDIADVYAKQRQTLEEGKKAAETYIPGLVASGVDVPKEMFPYNNGYRPEFTEDGSQLTGGGTYPQGSGIPTIYEQALSEYGTSTPSPAPAPQETTPPQTPYQAALSGAPQFTDPYKERRDAALERAESMQFSYDPNTDPVWQALQKQYRREGQRATEDTLGRYAAMTGGRPSTAAVTAASQAGDYYAAQLSDRLPQVYQDAYNRYLQEYQRQLGISDQYAQFGNTEYNRFEGDLAQWNKDRSFDYQRERDAISDQRWDAQWAQQLREYADAQNWKATEWQQYLREYGDKLSQQEREWAYQQMRDSIEDARYEDKTAYQRYLDSWNMQTEDAERAAKYGDYSGLQGLGIDTGELANRQYAYAPDGSTYDFSTWKAQSFVTEAPNGSTMRGGDGSIWRKDENGGVTIEKNGKTYTYSSGQTGGGDSGALSMLAAMGITSEGQAYSWLLANGYSSTAADKLAKYYGQMLGGTGGYTGSGYTGSGYTGSGSSGGSKTENNSSHLEALREFAPKTYSEALDFLMSTRGLSYNPANSMAKDYIAGLGGSEEAQYSEDDIDRAWKIIGDTKANPATVAWAQQVLTDTYGMDFGGNEQGAPESQDAGYRNFIETLDSMVRRGASRDELYAEIDVEVKDGRITKEQGAALKEQYYGQADNIENSGGYFPGGKPKSEGFDQTMQQAERMASMGSDPTSVGALSDFLMDAYKAGKIHEYEIDIILDRLGF